MCLHRRLLLICVLTALALWPCLLMLYLTSLSEPIKGDQPVQDILRQVAVKPKHKERKQKEPKKPKHKTPKQQDVLRQVAVKPKHKTPKQNEPKKQKSTQQNNTQSEAFALRGGVSDSPVVEAPNANANVVDVIKPCHVKQVKMRRIKGETFGLVTRIYRNDLPYVGSFIRHFQHLGVQAFYFELTRKRDDRNVRKYLSDLPLLKQTAWHLFDSDRLNPKKLPIGILRELIDRVQESWVVQVDIDEYVTLDCNTHDFRVLVDSDPNVALFRFGRVSVPLDSRDTYIVQPPYRGITDEGSKYLVKRTAVKEVPLNDYNVKLACSGEHNCLERTLPKTLVHFFARGFGDGLVKAVGAVHGNSQDSTWKKALWLARKGKIPVRLRMLAYMSVASRKSKKTGWLLDSERLPMVTVDMGEEAKLVKFYKVSGSVFESLAANYEKYKKNIARPSVWMKIAGHTSLARIAHAVA